MKLPFFLTMMMVMIMISVFRCWLVDVLGRGVIKVVMMMTMKRVVIMMMMRMMMMISVFRCWLVDVLERGVMVMI